MRTKRLVKCEACLLEFVTTAGNIKRCADCRKKQEADRNKSEKRRQQKRDYEKSKRIKV